MSSPSSSGQAIRLDSAQSVRRVVRATLDRRAYDRGTALAREVAQRMLERLEYVKLSPELVVDAGCGAGHALPGLIARFPEARVLAVDRVLPVLNRARASAPRGALPDWVQRLLAPSRVLPVAADIARLPLPGAAAGCVWSNLALHWIDDPAPVFAEWHRVLVTGGLAQFSLLGPDTLKELRAAWGSAGRTRVHPFIDMHDIGDMLIHAGFADPVMDMEVITLTYRELDDLVADLRASGATNVQAERPRGLTGRRAWRDMRAAYEAMRRDGTLPATFEIVYGHAWKPVPRVGRDGVAVVRVEDIGRGPR
jgi:malonyl-CoA O-methyltransferase